MRNILSLMFALDADQVTRLKHYVMTAEGKYDIANVALHIPVVTRNGRYETIIENLDINCDSLTKNIYMMLHIVDREGIREAMEKDDCIFTLGMKFSPRSKKMCFTVAYDGCPE